MRFCLRTETDENIYEEDGVTEMSRMGFAKSDGVMR